METLLVKYGICTTMPGRGDSRRTGSVLILAAKLPAQHQSFDAGRTVLLDDAAGLLAGLLMERGGEGFGVRHDPDAGALGGLGDQAGERRQERGVQARLRLVER